jgi:hypothetical protein
MTPKKKKEVIMKQIDVNPADLEKLITPELRAVYEIDITSIKADLMEREVMLSPIIVSRDGIPIDGFRRILAAKEIGGEHFKKVPVMYSDLDASEQSRVALNQHREKTWKDKRCDYLVSFKTFGNQQGMKSEKGYNRYQEIQARVNGKFKDPETLKVVEWILNNDDPSMSMAWWMLHMGASVAALKKLLTYRNEGKYQSVITKVIEKTLSPSVALKQIKTLEAGEILTTKTFRLPEKNSDSIVIHEGDPEEVLLNLKENSITTIFYEPERFVIAKGDSVEIYAMKMAKDVKPFLDKRFKAWGSFFLTVSDAYKNGMSLRVPSNVIDLIEKETGLIYKQTIFNTSESSTTEKKSGNQLPDMVSQILWFVKESKTEMKENLFTVKLKCDEVDNSALVYQHCSNHINNQRLSDMIVNLNDKNIVAGASAVIPMYLSTKENDLVVDLSLKGDVAAAAAIMNRKFIGVSASRKLYEKGTKTVDAMLKSYNLEMTKRLFGTPMERVGSKKLRKEVVA